jgi:protein-S-isoprenylcysteine O-methyltransferase Ste14
MRIPIPAVVIPVVVILLYLFVPGVKEQSWSPPRLLGAILAINGYVLLITARLQLGKSFAVTPQAKELVTHGLYARFRNPIYLSVDVMWFGLILVFGHYWLFVPWLALITFHLLRARREAKILQEAFAQAYIDYHQRTWF